MRKNIREIMGLALVAGALLTCSAANDAVAGVNVGIGVNPSSAFGR